MSGLTATAQLQKKTGSTQALVTAMEAAAAEAAADRAATALDRLQADAAKAACEAALGAAQAGTPLAIIKSTLTQTLAADGAGAPEAGVVPVTLLTGNTKALPFDTISGARVSAAAYGWTGTGDNTTPITRALARARTIGGVLVLPPGDVAWNVGAGVDLSGIAGIEGQNTTLRLTGAYETALQFRGGKALIKHGLTEAAGAARGSSTLLLGAGGSAVALAPGDRIALVSGEPIPYAVRNYYCRGEMATVHSYNAATGELRLVAALRYSYRDSGSGGVAATFVTTGGTETRTVVFRGASLYRISEPTLHLSAGLTVYGDPTRSCQGLAVVHASVVCDASFRQFGGTCMSLSGGQNFVRGVHNAGYFAGSGDSYAVSINDLAAATVQAYTSGGRHALATGGGGVWLRSDCQSTIDGADGPAAYPCSVSVLGGEHACTNTAPYGAIDAHAIVESMNIVGVVARGGISASARSTRISDSTITHAGFYGVSMTGNSAGYAPPSEEYSWGELIITNSHILGVGSVAFSSVQIQQGHYAGVTVEGVTIRREGESSPGGTYNRWWGTESAHTRIRSLSLDVHVEGASASARGVFYLSHSPRRFRVTGNIPVRLVCTPSVTDATLAGAERVVAEVDLDLRASTETTPGLEIYGGGHTAGSAPAIDEVVVRGRVFGAALTGVSVIAKRARIEARVVGAGRLYASGGNELRSGVYTVCDRVYLSVDASTSASSTQVLGAYVVGRLGSGVLDLAGCDLEGPSALNAEGYAVASCTLRRRTSCRGKTGQALAEINV